MGLATIMFLTEHFDKVDDMTIREIIDRERSRDNSPSGEKRG
jgi:hypothetical protein